MERRQFQFDEHECCRLCLSRLYALHPLFPQEPSNPNSALLAKINLLTEIVFIPSEEQQARICFRCVERVQEFHEFRHRCRVHDKQIRNLRKQQQQQSLKRKRKAGGESAKQLEPEPERGSSNSKNSREESGPDGIFGVVHYCKQIGHHSEEYLMRFDGYVYQSHRQSLLVWSCELASGSKCPCQLVVNHDFKGVQIYDNHNHDRIAPGDSENRIFTGMDPEVATYLEKLWKLPEGMDGIKVEEGTGQSVEHHSLDEVRQVTRRLHKVQDATTVPLPANTKKKEQYLQIFKSAATQTHKVDQQSEHSTTDRTIASEESCMFHNRHHYRRVKSHNSDSLWNCTAAKCPGTLFILKGNSQIYATVPHNHLPSSKAPQSPIREEIKIEVEQPAEASTMQPEVTPTADQQLPAVTSNRFYVCHQDINHLQRTGSAFVSATTFIPIAGTGNPENTYHLNVPPACYQDAETVPTLPNSYPSEEAPEQTTGNSPVRSNTYFPFAPKPEVTTKPQNSTSSVSNTPRVAILLRSSTKEADPEPPAVPEVASALKARSSVIQLNITKLLDNNQLQQTGSITGSEIIPIQPEVTPTAHQQLLMTTATRGYVAHQDINHLQATGSALGSATQPNTTLIPVTGIGVPENAYYLHIPTTGAVPVLSYPGQVAPVQMTGNTSVSLVLDPANFPQICSNTFIPNESKPEVRTPPQKSAHIRTLNFQNPVEQTPLASGFNSNPTSPVEPFKLETFEETVLIPPDHAINTITHTSGNMTTVTVPVLPASYPSRVPPEQMTGNPPICSNTYFPIEPRPEVRTTTQNPANSVSNTPCVEKDPQLALEPPPLRSSEVAAASKTKPSADDLKEWQLIRSVSRSNFDQHLRLVNRAEEEARPSLRKFRKKNVKRKVGESKSAGALPVSDTVESVYCVDGPLTKASDIVQLGDNVNSSVIKNHARMMEDARASAIFFAKIKEHPKLLISKPEVLQKIRPSQVKNTLLQTPNFPIAAAPSGTQKLHSSVNLQSTSGTGGFVSRRTGCSSGSSYYKTEEARQLQKAELEAKKQRIIARLKNPTPPRPKVFKSRHAVVTRKDISSFPMTSTTVPSMFPVATAVLSCTAASSSLSKDNNPTPWKMDAQEKVVPIAKEQPEVEPPQKLPRFSIDQLIEGTYEDENLTRLCYSPDSPDQVPSEENEANQSTNCNKENCSTEGTDESTKSEEQNKHDAYAKCSLQSFGEHFRFVYDETETSSSELPEEHPLPIGKCKVVLEERTLYLQSQTVYSIFEQETKLVPKLIATTMKPKINVVSGVRSSAHPFTTGTAQQLTQFKQIKRLQQQMANRKEKQWQ